MNYCGCGNEIHEERYALGYKVCITCGERFAQSKKKFGYVHYGHKTAGSIIVTSKQAVDNYRKVSYRHCKGSNMSSASKAGTQF